MTKFLTQSFAGWPYAPVGNWVKSEEAPLDPDSPPQFRAALNGILHSESSVRATFRSGGIVLRYGAFYGPWTSLSKGGAVVEAARKRMLPIVGGGTGVGSFVHIDDAASATVAALEGEPGIYNVTDDEPAQVRDWLAYLAEVLGAEPPLHVPAWLARLLIGEHGVALMRAARGASNEKIKRELGWKPAYPNWRDGFRKELQGLS